MKNTFKLNAKNAVLISKYAAILQQSPQAFLNHIVSDCMEQVDDPYTDLANFFKGFSFRSKAAAERFRSWLVDHIETEARQWPGVTIVETRIEEDPDGLFYVKGSRMHNDVKGNRTHKAWETYEF
jgi:hypothetical protein